jgi:peptide/nickel transport system substrate-binding protein
MSRKTRWKTLAGILVLCFLVVACTAGETSVLRELDQNQETAARSGTLRVAMQPIVQVDPAFISSDPEVLVASHIYDYLVDITPDNEIAPRLALEWLQSGDGLTYTFTLEEGVTFHDGQPLTAEDVVWTFNRLRDPQVGSPTAELYANISNIEAVGPNQVVFTLNQPNPFFLYDVSDNHALILKAGTTDPGRDFNGTGPFQVVDYSPEDRLSLAAYENYFNEGQPRLEEVEFIFFPDQIAQVEALRGGQVDLVMLLSSDLYLSLQDEPGLRSLQVSTNGFDLVRLRADRPPGDDPRVMQALRMATDRAAIFELVLQDLGDIGRDSPIGPLYEQYYSDQFPLPQHDPAAARAMLVEAGYREGLRLELHTPDTGNRPNLALVLKEQWAEAGVTVDIVVEPESVYYGDQGWLEVDLGITGWGSRPYPQFYLDVMLKCGAQWNESHFCDEDFDHWAEIAGTSLHEEERRQAYLQVQRILVERGPAIIPYFFAQLGLIQDSFEDFEMKAFPGRSDFRPVWQAQP